MKNLYKSIPSPVKTVIKEALVFFLLALAISHNVINAGVWGLFGAYLFTGLFLNDTGLSCLININLPLSLILFIASIINISDDIVNMPVFLPNTDVVSMSIVICIFSIIGLMIFPIGENLGAHEEYLKEFENI